MAVSRRRLLVGLRQGVLLTVFLLLIEKASSSEELSAPSSTDGGPHPYDRSSDNSVDKDVDKDVRTDAHPKTEEILEGFPQGIPADPVRMRRQASASDSEGFPTLRFPEGPVMFPNLDVTITSSRRRVRPGNDVVLNCRIGGESATLESVTSVTWSREGKPLPSNAQASGGQLTISAVRTENNGVYQCEVATEFGVGRKDYNLLIQARRRRKGRCPSIEIENGRVKIRSKGRVAKFKCRKGYTMVEGDQSVNCVRRRWNGTIPKCIPRQNCPLIDIENGRVRIKSRGRLAKFRCWKGYTMAEGDPTASCVRGQWNGTIPKCIPPTTPVSERPRARSCKATEFTCTDNSCIDLSKVCDSVPDCSDSLDERQDCLDDGIVGSRGGGRIGGGRRIGGRIGGGRRIGGRVGGRRGGCEATEHRCGDGVCVPEYSRCDGFSDCADKSDESCCGFSDFSCKNGQCISSVDKCNGTPECSDRSDEEFC